MAEVKQNTSVVTEKEGTLTTVNGERTPPGTYGKTEGGVPGGTPPSAPEGRNPAGEGAVEEGTGSNRFETAPANSHPDGPGVGGD